MEYKSLIMKGADGKKNSESVRDIYKSVTSFLSFVICCCSFLWMDKVSLNEPLISQALTDVELQTTAQTQTQEAVILLGIYPFFNMPYLYLYIYPYSCLNEND